MKSVSELIDPALTWDAVGWLKSITRIPVFVKGVLAPQGTIPSTRAKQHPAQIKQHPLKSPTDALLALRAGADGIVVSAHGGRQLDRAVAPLDALPAVVRAVRGRCPVWLDGGVRSGADVLVARALVRREAHFGAQFSILKRAVFFFFRESGRRCRVAGSAVDLWVCNTLLFYLCSVCFVHIVFLFCACVASLACGGEAGARAVLARVQVELDNVMAQLGARTLDDVTSDMLMREPKL